MLLSEKKERSIQFWLALRMGIPLLLLAAAFFFFVIRRTNFSLDFIESLILILFTLVIIYFLFFLIQIGQNERETDHLTGTFNREALFKYLNLLQKEHNTYTMVLFRIENLPFINDRYGVDKGDQLLNFIIHLMDEHFKIHNIYHAIIGRYAGSDFIVVIREPLKNVRSVFNDFTVHYQQIQEINIEYDYASATFDKQSESKALITHLYDSIGDKKNFSLKEKTIKPTDLSRMDNEIIEAIESGSLKLHFTPTLNAKSGKIDLFEVGMKLQTANFDLLPPRQFIPAVNRLGYERILDEVLIDKVCRTAAEIDDTLSLTFNISPYSLRSKNFENVIIERMYEYGVAKDQLIIELYENRIFKDIKRYRSLLEELKNEGVRFCLDNFGSFNASFEYVKTLPVDMVQFDREFSLAYRNKKYHALFEGLHSTAGKLGMKTMVKWVDKADQKEFFTQRGIDYIQGYILEQKPLDRPTLIKHYAKGKA